MKVLKHLMNRINLFLSRDNVIYTTNYIFLSIGLFFFLIYLNFDNIYKSSFDNIYKSSREHIVVSGIILLLHGIIVQSILSRIKDYTPHDNVRINGKRVLVEKKLPNTYKIQKDIPFAYVVLGTMISGFTNFTSLLN